MFFTHPPTHPLTHPPLHAPQQRAEELGIGSYGVSLTSLEQVFIRLAKEAGHTGEDSIEPSAFDKANRWLAKACERFSPGLGGWFRGFQYGYAKALVVENEGNISNSTPGGNSSSTAVAGAIALPSSSSSLSMPISSNTLHAGEGETDHLRRARAERYVHSGIADFEDHREDAVRADVQLAATSGTATTIRNNSNVPTVVGKNNNNVMTAGSGVDTRATNNIRDREGIELQFLESDHTVDFMNGERGEHKGEGGSASFTTTVNTATFPTVAAVTTTAAIPMNSPSNEGINQHSTSTPSSSQDPIKDGLSVPTTGKVRVQLYELLRKRYITTSRDLKGFFFQIVFPAIQICLILAILTISLNPAGHTVRLNASIYTKVQLHPVIQSHTDN